MSNTNIGMGRGSTVTIHAVRPYCDGPLELFHDPANAIIRFEQLKAEWGLDMPVMEELEVIDSRPEWKGR